MIQQEQPISDPLNMLKTEYLRLCSVLGIVRSLPTTPLHNGSVHVEFIYIGIGEK